MFKFTVFRLFNNASLSKGLTRLAQSPYLNIKRHSSRGFCVAVYIFYILIDVIMDVRLFTKELSYLSEREARITLPNDNYSSAIPNLIYIFSG